MQKRIGFFAAQKQKGLIVLELIKLKITEIKPYERNARKNDQAVDAVVKSIQQCSYVAPIVVDENYTILAGHTRWKALKKLGRTECECVIKTGLTEEQKKKYRLLDNKTNELADWDLDILAEEIAGLDFGDLQLDWGVGQKEAKVVEDDYTPEPPEEPKSKIGQVYQLGRHRLMCGDSTKPDDVAKLMNGELADMLLADPPYNVNYEGSAGKIQNDNMEDSAFREFLRLAFFLRSEEHETWGGFPYLACRQRRIQLPRCMQRCWSCGKAMFDLGKEFFSFRKTRFPVAARTVLVWRESIGRRRI